MKHQKGLSIFLCFFIFILSLNAQEKDIPKLNNPMSVQYLKQNLQKKQPRLVLNTELDKELKRKIKTDPVLQNMYEAIRLNAESIYDEPLLKHQKVGRRLLGVSREMLWRMNMLAMVYRIDKDEKTLQRINKSFL